MDWENFKTLIHTGHPPLLCINNWKNILKRNKLTQKNIFFNHPGYSQCCSENTISAFIVTFATIMETNFDKGE